MRLWRAVVGLLWLIGLWIWLWVVASPAHAEHSELSDLVLWVARVSTNEGAFQNRTEAALVWQATRNSGKNTAKRARWLRKHSPRVHGDRECKRGNCFWTPNLLRDESKPVGLNIPTDEWLVDIAPLWRDTFKYVDWMVRGNRSSEDPCHVVPKTWGCAEDLKRALREGLFPIGCHDTPDDGFTYEKYCWQGSAWVCDPKYRPSRT